MGVNVGTLKQLINACGLPNDANIFVMGKSWAMPSSELLVQRNNESNGCDLYLQVDAELTDWIDVELGVFPQNNSLVMVSFENFDLPDRALYKEDAEGGAFYPVGSEESFVQQGFFVNAWMPAPKSYRKF